ncbi:MAG: hypothetical protein IKS23_05570 [Alphaproteobacteria bacterium]|nr:hypothetical protein [Alphaproteobacteria bacterium]
MNRKILSITFLSLFVFVANNALAEPVNTYDSKGRVTKTVYDDGSYDTYYYYNSGGANKHTYNANGQETGFYNYGSTEDFANDRPNDKRLWTYDANGYQTSATYYWSTESIENDIPDSRYETTYDAQGNQIAGATYENGVLESKYTNTYNEEKQVWISESYNTPESIESGKPDYYNIYSEENNMSLEYDKDGNLSGAGGDVFEYDDEGNLIAYGWNMC